MGKDEVWLKSVEGWFLVEGCGFGDVFSSLGVVGWFFYVGVYIVDFGSLCFECCGRWVNYWVI